MSIKFSTHQIVQIRRATRGYASGLVWQVWSGQASVGAQTKHKELNTNGSVQTSFIFTFVFFVGDERAYT